MSLIADRHSLFRHVRRALGALILGGATLLLINNALAQSDNFNDGDLDDWFLYDPIAGSGLGAVGTFTNDNGVFRISSTPSPAPALVGPSRVGALRTDFTYTDFYVAVDIIDWNPVFNQVIGLMGRVSEIGLASSDGYAMTYDVAGGDLDISVFTDESPTEVAVAGNDVVNMVVGRSYRLEFIGKGTTLTGRAYALPDTVNPVAEITGVEASYGTGASGIILFALSDTAGTSAAFDNFLATVSEPPRLTIERDPFGGAVNILWPTNNADGFVLERSFSISTPAWNLVPPASYFLSGDRWMYTEATAPASQQFYRLMKP